VPASDESLRRQRAQVFGQVTGLECLRDGNAGGSGQGDSQHLVAAGDDDVLVPGQKPMIGRPSGVIGRSPENVLSGAVVRTQSPRAVAPAARMPATRGAEMVPVRAPISIVPDRRIRPGVGETATFRSVR
jgi:hypothetical protein